MPSAVIPSICSYPAVPLAGQQIHQRYVHPGPLVLGTNPLNSPTPTADRDRTVSRRSEPSSRTALMGEQPNPWDLLQPQDATSRHRGAKPSRRYGLLGKMSLLSPGYLLSVERRRFHTQPPDHYVLLSHLLDESVSQSSSLVPLHSTADCQPAWRCSRPGSRAWVRAPSRAGWYLNGDSTPAGADASQSPTYPAQHVTKHNTKL